MFDLQTCFSVSNFFFPPPERGRLEPPASCRQGMLVLSFTIELAEILIDMTSAARFEGVGGSRSVQPVLEDELIALLLAQERALPSWSAVLG